MTPEDALKYIDEADVDILCRGDFWMTVSAALEKQIPKKLLPADKPMSAVNVRCPECGRTFYVVEVVGALNYCPDCGQRIDWGDEE